MQVEFFGHGKRKGRVKIVSRPNGVNRLCIRHPNVIKTVCIYEISPFLTMGDDQVSLDAFV